MPEANTLLEQRYRLLARLGSGASGEMWRAHDERLLRPVAVKLVDLDAREVDRDIVAAFHSETRAAAAVASPYLVALYDSGEDPPYLFVVTELLSGPSLDVLLGREGRLAWGPGLALGFQMASGLADAHAAGMAHRDLKPANIVLNEGIAKIVDFGIAGFADTASPHGAAEGASDDTGSFRAPEISSGRDAGVAGDLYALGCLLFATFGEHRAAQGSAGATPGNRLSAQRPGTPPALATLIDALTALDPSARPDARAAARQLARLRDELMGGGDPASSTALLTAVPPVPPGLAVTPPAPPMPAVAPPATVVARRRSPLAWLATLALAAAAAVVGWTALAQLSPTAPATSTSPSPTASPTGTTVATASSTRSPTKPSTASPTTSPTMTAVITPTSIPPYTPPVQPTSASTVPSATATATSPAASVSATP